MADESVDRLSLDIEVNNNANTQLEKTLSNLDSVINKIETLNGLNIDTSKFNAITSSIENLSGEIDKISSQTATVSAPIDIDGLINSISKLDDLKYRLDETKAKIESLASGGATVQDNSQLRSLILQAQKLQGEIDKANNSTKSFDKSTSRLGNTSNIASKMLGKLSLSGTKLGKLFSAIKRIVFYRFIRSAIREITQAVTEGINNLYQYSKALNSIDGGTLSANLDRISTSLLYFKNSIGAIAAPIINAVTPAVEALIDRFAELNNRIAAFFAALSGQSVYSAAIKYNKAYADSALKVAAANKAALASFDEINNITLGDKSGGASALDYTKMFEEVETPVSILAEKIKNGDWYGVGETLATKLNQAVDKLSLSKIGRRISTKLQNALDIANGFLKKFSWGNFTTTILTELTTVVTNPTTWAKIGELISNAFIASLDLIDALAEWITSPDTFTKISDAFVALFSGTDEGGGIDWRKITSKLTTSMLNLAYNLGEFIGKVSTWLNFQGKFGSGLWNAIKEGLKGMWDSIKNWFDTHPLGNIIMNWIKTTLLSTSALRSPLLTLGELFGVSILDGIFGVSKNYGKTDAEKTRKSQFSAAQKMKGYASGGYPGYGEIYMARENGLNEFVGSIGNRPAVANNDQIVEAVSIGVYNAVVDAMTKTSQNQGKQRIVINGREIFSVVQEESQGYKRRTGQPAF